MTKFISFNIFDNNSKYAGGDIMAKFFTGTLSVLLLASGFLLGAANGSGGLLRVQTASSLKPGRLQLRPAMSFYTKAAESLGQNRPDPADWWTITGDASLAYGVMNHFDIAAMLRLYQDTNRPGEHNIPDDLFLDFKAGSIVLGSEKTQAGAMLSFRLPTGDQHNYPFELYAGGAFEFGFMGLFSYFMDPYFPDRDISFHLNLGYYSHNDDGQVLVDEITNPQGTVIQPALEASTSAAQVQYGAGFVFPTEMFNINMELWGGAFTSEPDSAVFSRENYMYFTPSITFKPVEAVNFQLGADIRITSDENTTVIPSVYRTASNLNNKQGAEFPNYSSWKFHLAMNFVLMPGGSDFRSGSGIDVRKKIDFYESVMKEKDRTKSIEEELRRLRREREQAEKELEELRQLLEEEDNQ